MITFEYCLAKQYSIRTSRNSLLVLVTIVHYMDHKPYEHYITNLTVTTFSQGSALCSRAYPKATKRSTSNYSRIMIELLR